MIEGLKYDPSMLCNGMLAGLVAITAPCAFLSPWAGALIGLVAGVIVGAPGYPDFVLTTIGGGHRVGSEG